MNDNGRALDRRLMLEAAHHLRTAIDLLDRSGVSGHIAAHADLSLSELDRAIAATRGPTSLREVLQPDPPYVGAAEQD